MIVHFSVNGTSFLQNGGILPSVSKADLFAHISELQQLVLRSKHLEPGESLSENPQTDYEILFQLPNKKQYRYTLCVSDTSVLNEELYLMGENSDLLFAREGNNIQSSLSEAWKKRYKCRENQLFFSCLGYVYGAFKEAYSFFEEILVIYTADLSGKLNKQIRKRFDSMSYEMKREIGHVTRLFLASIDSGILSVYDKLEINSNLFRGANQIGTYDMGAEVQSTGVKILLDFLPIFLLSQIQKGTLICAGVNDYIHSKLIDFLMEISEEHGLQFVVI